MAVKLSKKRTKVQKIVKRQTNASQDASKKSESVTFEAPNVRYTEAIGRRKVATARVRLYEQPGDFVVNDQIAGDYFAEVPLASAVFNQPLNLTDTKGTFTVMVTVSGSGKRAQLDAVVHGVARALTSYNPEFRSLLKQEGLLTRDDRMKETRKIGMGGKARRQRQSPKR